MPTRKTVQVESPILKQLLIEVERLGGRLKVKQRGSVTLKSICDRNPTFFGEGASDLRRAIQTKFDNISRKLTIEQYVEILTQHGITPSQETSLLYRQALFASPAIACKDTEDSVNFSSANSTGTSTVSSTGTSTSTRTVSSTDDASEAEVTLITSAEGEEYLEAQFDNLSLSDTPTSAPRPPTNHIMYRSPGFPSPVRLNLGSPALAPRGLLQMPLMSLPPTYTHDQIRGSFEAPHIIAVDVTRPHNNREFEVHRVQNIERNGYTHVCIVISKDIPLTDNMEWDAFATNVKGHENRAILIRGPSGGGHYRRDSAML